MIGLSLVTYSILSTKRRYVYVKTGNKSVTLDENVIQHYLDTYWIEEFPNSQIPSTFKVKKNTIQILADFPFLPQQEHHAFLEKIKTDFSDIFGRILGYPHEIQLIASFQSKQPNI